MRELEERIRRDGVVEDGDVLKVDGFLNHQMDVELFAAMGREWARLFAGEGVNKILTIEAFGHWHGLYRRPAVRGAGGVR